MTKTPTGREYSEPDPQWPTYNRDTHMWDIPSTTRGPSPSEPSWRGYKEYRPLSPIDYKSIEGEIRKVYGPPPDPPSRMSYFIAALVGSLAGHLLYLLATLLGKLS